MRILGVDFKKYPQCPKEIPDEMLDERWLAVIHGQSLKRLNERGGLSPGEVLLNLSKEGSGSILDNEKAIPKLIEKLKEYELSKL